MPRSKRTSALFPISSDRADQNANAISELFGAMQCPAKIVAGLGVLASFWKVCGIQPTRTYRNRRKAAFTKFALAQRHPRFTFPMIRNGFPSLPVDGSIHPIVQNENADLTRGPERIPGLTTGGPYPVHHLAYTSFKISRRPLKTGHRAVCASGALLNSDGGPRQSSDRRRIRVHANRSIWSSAPVACQAQQGRNAHTSRTAPFASRNLRRPRGPWHSLRTGPAH